MTIAPVRVAAPDSTSALPEQRRALGVPPGKLADADLERELAHLHATRHETFLHGCEDALETHTSRMLALEAEYLRRFPDLVQPDAARTRAGSRAAAGQR